MIIPVTSLNESLGLKLGRSDGFARISCSGFAVGYLEYSGVFLGVPLAGRK